MAKAYTNGKTLADMKANGIKIKCTGRACL